MAWMGSTPSPWQRWAELAAAVVDVEVDAVVAAGPTPAPGSIGYVAAVAAGPSSDAPAVADTAVAAAENVASDAATLVVAEKGLSAGEREGATIRALDRPDQKGTWYHALHKFVW